MWHPGSARGRDEPGHRRHRSGRVGNGELAVGLDEVELRVDIPENRLHETSSSRGFGRRPRPNFADGCPSVTTISPVKSFEPRISDEPTP